MLSIRTRLALLHFTIGCALLRAADFLNLCGSCNGLCDLVLLVTAMFCHSVTINNWGLIKFVILDYWID
jgi:hypothetical protein